MDFGLISSVVVAETIALILTISWALEMNLSKVLFASDCLQLVDFVNEGKGAIDWRCIDLLNDCRISFLVVIVIKLFILSVLRTN